MSELVSEGAREKLSERGNGKRKEVEMSEQKRERESRVDFASVFV